MGAMQRLRRESTVDSDFCVWLWIMTQICEHRKSVLGRQGFIINWGRLQVSITSPCVDALQILFRRIGIYLYFLNEEIERSESVRNLPELWVRPGVCYHTFLTFLSINNGENSFTGKSMIQFHDLKFPWKG